jgi:arginine repressor
MFVKVTGASLVRDINSMGISNIDTESRNEYYTKLRLINNQKESLNKVNEEISELRNEMGEIKELLAKLVSRQ